MTASSSTMRSRIHDFFYTEEPPYSLALVRIALPLVMLTMVLPRWQFARELYSTDGATAPLAIGYGYYHFLPEFSGSVAAALCTLLLFGMFALCVGWWSRLSAALCCVIYTYLSLLDAVSTMTKYSVIVTHLLLLLALSPCGAVWSVDAWLAPRHPDGGPSPPRFAAWPRRLMQLLIGFIYFGAAITKINTPEFLSGDQLHFWMLTHINFRHPIGEWLSLYPILIRIAGYVVIVWEMTFLFLVWNRFYRPWVLAAGVLFHLMTVLTLGLMIFPLTCYTCYLSFLEPEDIAQMRSMWRRLSARWPLWEALAARWTGWLASPRDWSAWQRPARAGFVALGALVTAGGVALEYHLDLYGERRPEGRYQLKPIAAELAARLLAPPQEIREVDKFFAVDTGTILAGDLLANRRKVFRHGEKLIAQCTLIPPHEDMWVECKIRDPDNRLVDRLGNIVLREQFRANFQYPITSAFAPGTYTLVFESAGREVIRKRIQIVGDGKNVVSAN
jgi:hypothetical protein